MEMIKVYGPIKDQADVAKKNLVATTRAWIKITQMDIIEPGLTFDETGAHFTINIKIKNVGFSPAIYGRWHVWLFTGAAGTGKEPNRRDDLRNRCNKIRNDSLSQGVTVFPNDDYPRTGLLLQTAVATKEEIASVQNMGQYYGPSFSLYVGGCFDYTFATDINEHHQVEFFRIISRIHFNSGQLLPGVFVTEMQKISADELQFVGDLSGAAD
jgi:hypothetical protein